MDAGSIAFLALVIGAAVIFAVVLAYVSHTDHDRPDTA
jgi:hypothetical protein